MKVRYKTTWNVRRDKRVWRARLRGYGLCITTPRHGTATHGCRCKACYETHRRSA